MAPATMRLIVALAAMFASLALGSLVRLIALRGSTPETSTKRWASLRTWWILCICVAVALLTGKVGVCLFMAMASWLALREFIALVAIRPADRRAALSALAYVPIHYGLILAGWHHAALALAPLICMLTLQVIQVLQGQTDGYIRSTAGLFWGVMVLVYALSHTALLYTSSETSNPVAGAGGWLLYLILLTELNDIAQALVGRRLGAQKRHRLTPRVSPNKTWEGFVGGGMITVVLSYGLAAWLTPWLQGNPTQHAANDSFRMLWPLAAGALAIVGGLFGDVNMSAVKRDAKVKDSSSLLPGMGGVIDRVDSLTVTAPLFYYLVRATQGGPW